MKIKTFTEYGGDLDKKVNEWLEKNSNVVILHANLSVKGSSSAYFAYVIMYEDKIQL